MVYRMNLEVIGNIILEERALPFHILKTTFIGRKAAAKVWVI